MKQYRFTLQSEKGIKIVPEDRNVSCSEVTKKGAKDKNKEVLVTFIGGNRDLKDGLRSLIKSLVKD